MFRMDTRLLRPGGIDDRFCAERIVGSYLNVDGVGWGKAFCEK